jgi:hypothetical protein
MAKPKKDSELSPLEATLGKELVLAKTFTSDETFGAYGLAEEYCRSLGLSVGRMCSPLPTAVKQGTWDIAKWKNLSVGDKYRMDGAITGDNYRSGPVSVYLVKELIK